LIPLITDEELDVFTVIALPLIQVGIEAHEAEKKGGISRNPPKIGSTFRIVMNLYRKDESISRRKVNEKSLL